MRKSNSATRVLQIPSTLSLTSARIKQPQAKIPVAFLFSRLHFNRVTSNMLFFTMAILLCAVRDAQCKTSESP